MPPMPDRAFAAFWNAVVSSVVWSPRAPKARTSTQGRPLLNRLSTALRTVLACAAVHGFVGAPEPVGLQENEFAGNSPGYVCAPAGRIASTSANSEKNSFLMNTRMSAGRVNCLLHHVGL